MGVSLSVVIVNWNTGDLLARCLESLPEPADIGREIIVVDNGSTDGSATRIARNYPDIQLIRNAENLFFTKACNQGIRKAKGDYILLANSDIEFVDDAIDQLLDFMESRPETAAAAPMLLDERGETLRTCMRFPTIATALFYYTTLGRLFPRNRALKSYYLRDWDHRDSRPVDQPPAACLLIRKNVIDQIGLLDERMLLYFSDVDLCKRIRAEGYPIWYVSGACAIHAVGASTTNLPSAVILYQQDRVAYYRKYFGRFGALVCKLSMLDLAMTEIFRAWRRGGRIDRGFRSYSQTLVGTVWRGMLNW